MRHVFFQQHPLVKRQHGRLGAVASMVVAASLALTACAPGVQAGTTSNQGAISTAVPADKKITLTLSHYETGGGATAIDQLVKGYEKLHPNVTVKIAYTSFNDYGKRIKLTMSSASAPDIAEVGQAYVMTGPLVKAGLLRPLDDYAKAYGWASRFKAGLLDEARFQPDAKSFGTGKLYGMALGGNMAGIFYNKNAITRLGITVPFANVADFEKALSTAKAAGDIPIALGNSDQWPANHILSTLISQYEPQQKMLGWIYGKAGATFDSAGIQRATETMASWSAKQYIDPAANGISMDDSLSRFAKGTGVFSISGNWNVTQLSDQMGDNVGFTAFPPAKTGQPLRATGATTSPYGISSKSKNPDVAANFIDYMTAPAAAKILTAGGYAPLTSKGQTPADASPLQKEFNTVWSKVLADDGLTLYLDWATTNMGDTLFPAIQELMAGKITSKNLITTVQSEWVRAHQ
ncbi:extracellular solute-binding protein [Glaciihabitans sp. INWT7]|uniref:ABC transporter substrate-binding protein n=1 Tax=Glaciihabitans sp. INWT7 TaxID=2596912 RepID=UPI0016261367|nr:extracellular solute-binding protein [Glaciihabitans sp. INWT7]QNE46193.1 extracellular solute-binding protein [Glaciihabitans sp. INWT7]